MGRLHWGFFLLLAWTSVASAATSADPFNVDMNLGWDGAYRVGRWSPVEIGISTNLKQPFGGSVILDARQDDLHRMAIAHPFVVTDQAPARISLATKLSPLYDRSGCQLSLVDDKGRTVWTNDYELWNLGQGRNTSFVPPSQLFVGVCGKRGFSLTRLGENFIVQKEAGEPDKIVVKEKLAPALPWDWTGYDCLDVLILYDVDWATLRPQQVGAIRDWVSRGGRLMLILGAHPLPQDSGLQGLLPVKIGEMRSRDVEPSELIERISVTPRTVNARELEILDPRLCQACSQGKSRLAVTGRFGFGQVLLLGFDPAELEQVTAEVATEQWSTWLADIALPFELVPAKGTKDLNSNPYGRRFQSTQAQLANVQQYLQSIPQLRPLSVGWILLLLLSLAVLLGPVDYLVLKKLDRLPLTWLTSLVIIGGFTAAAYFGARALRSGDLQLRFVSSVDAIQDGPAWQSTYYGIYAPSSANYEIAALGKGQWWSPFSFSEANMYGYRSSDLATRTIACHQYDGMNVPPALPINIWSMQCMQEECSCADVPLRVTWQAGRATITNTSSSTLSDVAVRMKNTSQIIDSIGPGQSVTLDSPSKTPYGRRFAESGQGGNEVSAATFERNRILNRYMDAGAMVVSATVDAPPSPHQLAKRSAHVTGQQSVRLVVLPPEVNHD